MKRSELEDMIRTIVKEEVSNELGNAFRYVVKEMFANKGSMITEASGRPEDYTDYQDVKNVVIKKRQPEPVQPVSASDDADYQKYIAANKARMAAEMGYGDLAGSGGGLPVTAIPTTNPDGRPINLSRVDPSVISALTKNYSGFLKTVNGKK